MTDPITVEDDGLTRTVTIDRPDSMNAMTPDVLTGLAEAFRAEEVGDEVRAAVLTGAGETAFCAGIDLKERAVTADQSFAEYREGLGLFQDAVRAVRNCEAPVVAAVNGYALGAGCDLSLAADFRVASENAAFGETFVDVGLVPGDGGAYLLPRLIGEANARELLYTGRHVGPEEAVELGMAREAVPADGLMDAARDLADDLAGGPTLAIAHTKRLVNESFDVDLETALDHATTLQRECSESHDHEEAVEAFAEGRDPEFEGR